MARQKKEPAIERREVKERIEGYSIDLDYTDFDRIIDQLNQIKNHPDNAKYHKFEIWFEQMAYSDIDKEYPYPCGYRWETDEELAARVEKERQQEEERLARDRATWERLQRQFGDK
jgi:hypothetical protein